MRHVQYSRDGRWATAIVGPGDVSPPWCYKSSGHTEASALRDSNLWKNSDFGGFPEDQRLSGLSMEEYAWRRLTPLPMRNKSKDEWWAIIFQVLEPATNELGEVSP